MKVLAALGVALTATALSGAAEAGMCRPPIPGTWYDARVDALTQTGMEKLQGARAFEGDAQRAAANQAEMSFREIDARVPCLPPIVVALAQALELQQKYREAAEQYRRLVDSSAELTESGFWDEALEAAKTGLSVALAKLGTIVVELKKSDCAKAPPSVVLTAPNGALVPLRVDRPIDVNPSKYQLRVDAEGCKPFHRDVDVAPGEPAPVSVVLERANDATCNWQRCVGIPTWVLITGGALLAAAGTVGVVALTQSNDEKPPPTFDCSSSGAALGCASLLLRR